MSEIVDFVEEKKSYDYYVLEAKKTLIGAKNKQMRVATIATYVCDISHGGRRNKDQITVVKFSNDIGMNPRTLNEWIRVKNKIYDNLEPKYRREMKYEQLWRVSRRVKVPYNAKKINAIAKDELESPDETIKFRKYLSHLRAILYNSKRPEAMEFCNNELVFEMIYTCDLVSKNLRSYLKEYASERKLKDKKHQEKLYKSIVAKYEGRP